MTGTTSVPGATGGFGGGGGACQNGLAGAGGTGAVLLFWTEGY
jgi:hypothetical protein